MKTTLTVVAVALLLGLGFGSALGYWRASGYRVVNDQYFGQRPFDFDSRFPPLPAKGAPLPRAMTEHETYDFGTVEDGVTLQHAFPISNAGTGVLELRTGETTCKCTISGLDSEQVEPGESTQVTLEWTVDGMNDRFAQTAVVLTNDPHHRILRFRVQGNRKRTLLLQPQSLSFAKAADETIRLESHLAGDLEEPFEVEQIELLNTATAEYFDVEAVRMTPEQLTGGLSRQGFTIVVRVKPGLPLGPVQQTIRLVTDRAELKPLELSLNGMIESGISVAGRDWDPRAKILRLGVLRDGQGASARLVISVRGAMRDEIELRVGRVDPAHIDVRVGQWTEIGKGRVRQVPVTIEIPPGSPAVSRWGGQQGSLGEIVLETDLEAIPEVRIPVQFAVEG